MTLFSHPLVSGQAYIVAIRVCLRCYREFLYFYSKGLAILRPINKEEKHKEKDSIL